MACLSSACCWRPFVLGDFYVGEFSYVFILAIAGVGLMLLIGYTGLASLGHGAFMAIGAYTNTYLITKGVPFLIAFPAAGLAALLAGVAHCGAGQPHDGHLPGHRHARLLADRRAARDPLGIGDARLPGHAGAGARASSAMRSAKPWEFYYFCLAVLVAGGACRHQPDAIAHGPRDGGDPRLRRSRRRASASTSCATRPSPSR